MRVSIFIAVLFVALANASIPITKLHLGAQECTWGPSYWCKNLTSAAHCQATEHCIQTEWIKRQLPPDGSSICQTCQESVKIARDQPLSNEAQDLILQAFEDMIVDNLIPDLIDTLASEIDSQLVCSFAGLCNNPEIIEKTVSGSTECTLCELAVKEVEDLVKSDKTEAKIKEALGKVCSKLPTKWGDKCQQFVDKHTDELIKLLIAGLNPQQVCSSLSLCSTLNFAPALPEPVQEQKTITGSTECTLCELAVKEVEDLVKNDKTEAKIKEALGKVCSKLPTKWGDKCQQFVDKHTDELIQLLIAGLNPQQVCSRLALCSTLNFAQALPEPVQEQEAVTGSTECTLCELAVKEVEDLVKSDKTEAKIKEALGKVCSKLPTKWGDKCQQFVDKHTDELIQLLIAGLNPQQVCSRLALCSTLNFAPALPEPVQEQETVSGSTECTLCELAVKEVQDLVKNDKTEAKIKEALGKVCSKLPTKWGDKCQQFVDKHTDELIQLLIAGLNPQEVCSRLALCSALPEPVQEQEAFTGSTECTLCELAVKEVQDLVKNDKTEAKIKEALGKVCSKLPTKWGDKCQQFVDKHTDELIQLLIAGLNPQEVCSRLALCSALPEPVQEQEAVTGSTECTLCELAVKEVEDLVKSDKTEAKIKEALGKVCSKLPTKWGDKCQQFVDKHTDELIQLLIAGLNPQQVCSRLALCSALPEPVQEQEAVTGSTECTLCELAVKEVEDLVKSDKTEAKIKEALGKVCSKLPTKWGDKCQQFVDKHTDELIQLLIAGLNPQQVCSRLALCSALPEPVQEQEAVTGSTECTLCELAVKEVEDLVKSDKTEAKIKEALGKVCSKLPTKWGDKCQQFVDKHTDELIQLLIAGLNPQQVCSRLALCSALPEPVQEQEAVTGSTECTLCELAVKEVEDLVKSDKTEAKIKEALGKVCSKLPTKWGDKCQQFVDKHTDELIQLLIAGLNPQQVCSSLALCSSPNFAPALLEPVQEQETVTGSTECTLCELAVKEVQDLVKNDKTEAKIKEALGKVCSKLPTKWGDKCQQFVDKHTDELIQLLIAGLNPQQVCSRLALCSALPEPVQEQEAVTGSTECTLCELAVKEVEDLVKSDKTEAKIKEALGKVCSKLPTKWGDKCQQFVDKHTDELIQLLIAGLNPQQVCSRLALCSALPEPVQEQEAVTGSTECTLCELAVKEVEDLVKSDKTEAKIKEALGKVCSKLPTKWGDKCQQFVDKHTDELIKLLIAGLNPQQVCSSLSLCSEAVVNDVQPIDQLEIFECPACEATVWAMQKILGNSKVDHKLESVLEKTCKIVPSKYRGKCQAEIQKYGPKIFDSIVNHLGNKRKICRAVGMC